MTSLFSPIVAEYKTRKAADNFAKRIAQKTFVRKAERAHYDPLSTKPVYQVILQGGFNP